MSLADEGELRRFLGGQLDAPLASDPLDLGGKLCVERKVATCDNHRFSARRDGDDQANQTVRAPRLGQLPLKARTILPATPSQPVSLAPKTVLIAQCQLAQRRVVGHPDRE